jgi:hypothetical protein
VTHFSAGLVISGSEGCVHIRIWSEHYYVCPEDLGMLLFVGDHVPLLKKESVTTGIPLVSGSIYLSPSGRAVIMAIGKTYYMLPRDRFIAVAFGEDVSCILFEVPSDASDIEIISPSKRGAIS